MLLPMASEKPRVSGAASEFLLLRKKKRTQRNMPPELSILMFSYHHVWEYRKAEKRLREPSEAPQKANSQKRQETCVLFIARPFSPSHV